MDDTTTTNGDVLIFPAENLEGVSSQSEYDVTPEDQSHLFDPAQDSSSPAQPSTGINTSQAPASGGSFFSTLQNIGTAIGGTAQNLAQTTQSLKQAGQSVGLVSATPPKSTTSVLKKATTPASQTNSVMILVVLAVAAYLLVGKE